MNKRAPHRRHHSKLTSVVLAAVSLMIAHALAIAAPPGSREISDDVPAIAAQTARARALPPPSQRRPVELLAGLPLSFAPNLGQTDNEIRFVCTHPRGVVALTRNGITLRQSRRTKFSGASVFERGWPLNYRGTRQTEDWVDGDNNLVKLTFVGANRDAHVAGEAVLPGRSNYFFGNDAKRWHTNVPTYRTVRYKNLYPGIDLAVYGSGRGLEYDFVVAPGANPSAIEVAITGGDLEIDPRTDGVLVTTPLGALAQTVPAIYQEHGGGRRTVPGAWVRRGANRVGFRVAAYDRTKPLVIDPVLEFATYLGGQGYDAATAIAVDAAGDVYVTGFTTSLDFPTKKPLQSTSAGQEDAFVTKIKGDGTAVVFSTFLGGTEADYAAAIAVDRLGQVYVAGTTDSYSFPTTPSAFQTRPPSCSIPESCPHAWVAKLDALGASLIYSTFLAGRVQDIAFGIAVDDTGYAYVTGYTLSPDFPTKGGLPIRNPAMPPTAFVAKINPAGTQLVYSTRLGGSAADAGSAIAVDNGGYAYLTGVTSSGDFPVVSAIQPVLRGSTDAFIAKLNPAGDALVWATYLGGSRDDEGADIAVDAGGYVVVAGVTSSEDFPLSKPLQTRFGGGRDAFVAKLKPDGSALEYSTYLGGRGDDGAYGIAIAPSGSVFVSGLTASADFPTANPWQAALAGSKDAFVSILDPTGTRLEASSFLGGSGAEESWYLVYSPRGPRVAVTAKGDAFVAGITTSTDFPVKGALQPNNAGGRDAFVVKIGVGTELRAQASAVPSRGAAPLLVSFSGSAAGGTPPYVFDWDFGDGSTHANSQNPSHTYNAVGNYVAVLTARDAGGATSSASVAIMAAEPCTLGCGAAVSLAVTAGQPVSFSATVSPSPGCAGTPSLLWEFGDGTTSSQQNSSHTYVTPGLYSWSFTATLAGQQCFRQGLITITTAPSLDLYLVPAVAHKPGFLGTQWRTDLAAVNHSGLPANMTVVYLSAGAPLVRTATLANLATMEWRDVATSLFGLSQDSSSSGAVHVISNVPLAVTARTYNQTATGTLGQSYPALTPAEGLSFWQIGVLPQLKKNAAFRTNIGVLNLGTSDSTVTIALFNAAGAPIGSPRRVVVPAGRWRQEDDVFRNWGTGDQDLAYALIEVEPGGGNIWAYASVIDNATGDPTTVPVLVLR